MQKSLIFSLNNNSGLDKVKLSGLARDIIHILTNQVKLQWGEQVSSRRQ